MSAKADKCQKAVLNSFFENICRPKGGAEFFRAAVLTWAGNA